MHSAHKANTVCLGSFKLKTAMKNCVLKSSNGRVILSNVGLAYSECHLDTGNHFTCWYPPAVQHLTASAGSGRKGQTIKPGKKVCAFLVM